MIQQSIHKRYTRRSKGEYFSVDQEIIFSSGRYFLQFAPTIGALLLRLLENSPPR